MTQRHDGHDEHDAQDEHEHPEAQDDLLASLDEGADDREAPAALAPDTRDEPPPAPVVTDEGVYGTLPERQWVEREYTRHERPWRDSLVRLAGVVLALSLGLWLALYSASQATGEVVARPAIESVVEQLTGLSGLLTLHAEAIREDGEVPGYPLAGVAVPVEDRDAGMSRWREVVLAQSSAAIYATGADAFNPVDGAAGAGTFSTPGGTRLVLNNLTEQRNGQASALLWPLALVVVVAATITVAVGSGFVRFQALGFALVVAALPAIAAALMAYGLIAFAGSDGSALAESVHDIAWELAGIPLRNGLTVLIGGLVLVVAARIASLLFGRVSDPEPDPLYD